MGVYIFFIIVEDNESSKEFTTIRVYYNVTNTNDPPNITFYSPNNTNVSAAEGAYLNFSIVFVEIDKGDVNNVSWFRDGTLVSNDVNWSTGFPNFCNSGSRNITVVVNDSAGTYSSVYWNVTVNNSDRSPTFNSTISNFTWSQGVNITNVINLSRFFNDSDAVECGD